ncbi:MAG: hypothetical protein U0793_20005 [Gemmataceae bacterium]
MAESFSIQDFIKALNEDRLKETFALEGMVKKADDPNTLMFAAGTSCRRWVSIPIDLITNVTWLGKVPCRDHTHDLVRLEMKEPQTAEARMLRDLLNAVPMPLETARSLVSTAMPIPRAPDEGLAGMHVPIAPPTSGVATPSSQTPFDTRTDLGDRLLRFPASAFDPCTPEYGRWCGNCRTSSPETPPVDAVDAACKSHDLCIDENGHHCDCDSAFLSALATAVASPGIGAEARTYALGAIAAFQVKPCFCYRRIFGRRVKVWGVGGRCLG